MIYFNNINMLSEKTLEDQVDELSEGTYYLEKAKELERKRMKNHELYYNGKRSLKEYSKVNRDIINDVLTNIKKNEIFSSTEEVPF